MEPGGGELLPGPGRPGLPVTSKPGGGRGGWRAALFIVAMGFFERIGFVGVSANLIMYLTGPLGMPTAAAAAGVNAWSGTVQVLPLVGALVADSRLGWYRALLAACLLYLLAFIGQDRQQLQPCLQLTPLHHTTTITELGNADRFIHDANRDLVVVSISCPAHPLLRRAVPAGSGARLLRAMRGSLWRRPVHPSGSGEPSAPAFRSSYFNWFHFSISWGYAIASAGLNYVQDNAGWTVGFGACWTATVLCLAVFLLGTRTYRGKQPVDGGTFAETVRPWAATVFRRKDNTPTDRLLASQPASGGGGLVAKLLPIWLTSLIFAAIFSQVSTLFTKQASTLDRHLGTATGLLVPAAALQCLTNITFIVMLPLYDRVIVPLARRLTGHAAGITMLQRIGASMATSCVAMVVAALVEAMRLVWPETRAWSTGRTWLCRLVCGGWFRSTLSWALPSAG